MDMSELQLRTAAVGGFQKQDVVAYVESLTQKHREELAQREQNLAALQEQLDREKAQRASLEEKAALLERENAQLAQQTGEGEKERASLSDRLEKSLRHGEELEKETERLRGQVETLQPQAEAYLAIKDRTASIELDAHQRAQLLQDQSDEEFHRAHEELCRWSEQVREEYHRLRSDMDTALGHTTEELKRAEALISALTEELLNRDADLDRLMERYCENHSKKLSPPAPMPLAEN